MCVSVGLWCTLPLWAEDDVADCMADSARSLGRVTVTARRMPQIAASVQPVQVLDRTELEALGVQSVADAVRRMPGATVKDYGGIGGLKTVSVRGLGAEHTAVAYDGVAVSNCQAGQIDIGRFNLDDVELLSLAVGQPGDLMQSARLYASAGVLSITTRNPLDGTEKPFALGVQLKGGSFGQTNPSLRWAQRLGERTSCNVTGNFLRADGRYPFTLVNGRTVTREQRHNTDIRSWYTEGNLYHTFHDGSRLNTKVYYFDSERGLPGSIVLYNNIARERLWDRNGFVQSRYTKTFSEAWRLQVEGKYNYGYSRYEDANVKYAATDGIRVETNKQQEYYLSGVVLWMPLQSLSVSWSNDFALNTLDSDIKACPQPVRHTWLSALNARWTWRNLTLNGTLVGTLLGERVGQGERPDDLRHLSPTVSLLYRPWMSQGFYVRLMYKDTFRVPTFNDLYYTQIGNTGLRPEKAHEYNVGLTWDSEPHRVLSGLTLTADAYYNKVDDKIVAMPSMYVWRMMNYGRVDIVGTDVSLRARSQAWHGCRLSLTGGYAYQKAVDLTSRKSKTYKNLIPYTPKHSGSVGAILDTPWLSVGYSMVAAGARYCQKQNLPEYRLARYAEHTLSASREFRLDRVRLRLQAEAVNLTDAQYEAVRFYPMPGRSYRGTLQIEL